ncbi:hypothetical protein HJFPF1_09455 [Paramyrothecium foliicola]|nr:hypothetical protein HJFPF1_09455 [Paramyrothecium foliicola]
MRRLLVVELGVAREDGEDDKRHGEADTSDGQQALDALVGGDHASALVGADSIQGRDSEGVGVDGDSQGRVDAAELVLQLAGKQLRPESSRNGIAQGRSNVVGGQVQTSHDSQMLVLQVGLERSLGRVGEETTGNTKDDLSGNDTGATIGAGHTTVVDQKAESNHGDEGTGNDEDFEAAHLVHNQAEEGAGNDTDEGVEGGDASGALDAKVEGDNEDGVEVIGLHVPGKVEEESNAHGRPDGAVLHEPEGNERVRSAHLPENKGRNAEHTDDQRRNDVGLVPLGLEATGESKGHKNEGEDGNEKNDADDVETPEQLNGVVAVAERLEGGAVVLEVTLLLGTAANDPEAEDERQSADGVDDAPHADAPFPGGGGEDGGGNVTADPGVDDEGGGGDVAEEETGAGGGDVGNDDLDEQDDHGVADLVDDAAGAEGLDVCGDGLDDGAEDVEEDGEDDELDAAKDVGNLGRGGLGGGGDDGAQDADGGQQRVVVEGAGGGGLVGVAQGAVEAVDVGDEEDAEEDEDAVERRDGLGQALDAEDAGRLGLVAGGLRGRGHAGGVGGRLVDVLRLLARRVLHRVGHCGGGGGGGCQVMCLIG